MASPKNTLKEIQSFAQKAADELTIAGFDDYAKEVSSIMEGALHERFTVAIVGEFNRGKSSLVNKILGRELLPVGTLPTTAIMTEVLHGKSESFALFDETGRAISKGRLTKKALDAMTLSGQVDKTPAQRAVITVKDEWLKKADVVICDTPGAGDLDEGRSRQIGEMLWRCDGVIVAIDANMPLSMTEKLFIEERIIAKKISTVMIVVTKLDMIDKKEREGILRFIKKRLSDWKLAVSVCVTDKTLLPAGLRKEFGGIEELKKTIMVWKSDSEAEAQRMARAKANIASLVNLAISSLASKLTLAKTKDAAKRAELLTQRKDNLQKAKTVWDSLNGEMRKKSNICYAALLKQISEDSEAMVERLQFEASHAGDCRRWWTEDYPYRVKIELANLAIKVEGVVVRNIVKDIKWYNDELNRMFKTTVPYVHETIVEKPSGSYGAGEHIEIKDLGKNRIVWRVGSTALTIAAASLLMTPAALPVLAAVHLAHSGTLIATMGLGTGVGLLSEQVFKKKIEAQREEIKREIAHRLPMVIQSAMASAETKLGDAYDKIINDGKVLEDRWLAGQQKAIEAVANTPNSNSETSKRITALKTLLS